MRFMAGWVRVSQLTYKEHVWLIIYPQRKIKLIEFLYIYIYITQTQNICINKKNKTD